MIIEIIATLYVIITVTTVWITMHVPLPDEFYMYGGRGHVVFWVGFLWFVTVPIFLLARTLKHI